MVERSIGDLLEEIDKAGKITVGELEKKGFDRVLMRLAGEYNDLIRLAYYPDRRMTNPLNESDHVIVSPSGYGYLNPIKIKKAIDKLDASITKFNESSDRAYCQLNDSIRKFDESSDKSSKKMIVLTYAIYTFTVIVVLLTIIEKILQLFPIDPKYKIVWMIFAVFGTVMAMSVFYYFYEKEDS